MENLESIHFYYKERIGEVRRYSTIGDVWVFLMCSVFIEYMVKIVSGKEATHQDDYKEFIRAYLSKINPLYKDFKYSSGTTDLPEQMYHVLRCGIVHGFSLIADKTAQKKNGRNRSILLGHRSGGGKHLELIATKEFDSAFFCAEDFALDIERLVDFIFELAKSDEKLKNQIIQWIKTYPPISFLGSV